MKRKIILLLSLLMSVHGTALMAEDLSPETQARINTYKKKLIQWSNDKDIISAVEEMNQRVVTMNNQVWNGLPKDDPEVLKFEQSTAGKKLADWKQDKALGKLFLRDSKGNLVAGSQKPAVFNIADRKPFMNAMKGLAWNSNKPKPDPTTKLSSVQISAPVVKDGKQIGVIHTSLIVDQ